MLLRRLVPGAMIVALAFSIPPTASAQQSVAEATARDRANGSYETGVAHFRREAFAAAAKSFEEAIAQDATFEMAHYMLGRTHMALRNYVAATLSLSRARELFQADSTRQFTSKQERQRVLRERIRDIDGLIDATRAAADNPANSNQRRTLLEDVRQFEERKRQLQDFERNDTMQPTTAVPAFVSLALGSAYFRAGKLADAEQAYLAAVATDPKVGEAHNNLAVVYLETGRYDEAEKAVKAAEKAGLRVNPALKEEIAKRKKS
jgi:tetratricopeptide (TPR) repeat protein